MNSLFGISGGKISNYNHSKVLGMYNNDGFDLELRDMPSHDLVRISFDLYIHDSWDGNDRDLGGPDIWQMKMDGDMFINTTFSNCSESFCLPQSYPLNYFNNKHAAKSGAYRADLPGVCHFSNIQGGTSLYKIVKTIRHSAGVLSLQCQDMLVQTNVGTPVCDESWSVDNLKIKVIKLN